MKKRILCFFTAFFIFFSVIFIDVSSVSAESVSFVFPDAWYDSSIENNHTDYDQALENIKSNPSLSGIDHLVFCIQGFSQNKVSFILMKPSHYELFLQGSTTYTTAFGDYFYSRNSISVDSLSTYPFEFEHPVFPPTTSVSDSNITYNHTSTKYTITNTYYDGTKYSWYIVRYPMALYSFSTTFVFDPVLSPLLDYPYNLDIQTQGFTEWLITNQKYKDILSSMLSAHVNGYVELFAKYGGSLSFFKKWVSQYFNFLNIGQGISDYNVILNKTRQLYQEYLRLKNDTVGNHLNQRLNDSDNILPDTNNNNTSLVTNDANDSTIISILRDILRALIALPNTLYDLTNVICSHIDNLNLTTTIVNDGGSNSDYTSLLEKMDDIIDAIGNREVNVDIDQTTQDNTDDFFNDWNDAFSAEVSDKFPVITQLHSLFSDDFFEKCGIDYNNDGAVYSYYSSSAGLTRSGSSTENEAVSDFISNFGGADPNFLNSASFSESVPDWSINIGGSDVSIFNFNLYAKYRDQIHFIIGFIAWTFFLLGLYKSLPSVIGGVASTADVVHSLSDD